MHRVSSTGTALVGRPRRMAPTGHPSRHGAVSQWAHLTGAFTRGSRQRRGAGGAGTTRTGRRDDYALTNSRFFPLVNVASGHPASIARKTVDGFVVKRVPLRLESLFTRGNFFLSLTPVFPQDHASMHWASPAGWEKGNRVVFFSSHPPSLQGTRIC